MYREKSDGKERRWSKRKMEPEERWMDGWRQRSEKMRRERR